MTAAVAAAVRVAAVAVLAVCGAACTEPQPRPPAATAVAAANENLRSCLVGMPPDWATALDGHGVPLPAGVTFTVSAQAGGSVFGQSVSAAGTAIAELDLATGTPRAIAPVAPDAGGLGWMAADQRWVVWEQLDSQTNLSDWSVHAHDRATGTTSMLATSRLPGNGGFLPGQQPLPVLRDGVAAWAQPLPRTSAYVEAQLRAVRLSTGEVSVLDSGRLSSPVYAGPYLVWGRIGADGGYSLRAADAGTLAPVALPDTLARPGPVGYLAGSDRYLVWSSADHTSLRVWESGSARLTDLPAPDPDHPFQFLQAAGHFVLWYTGAVSSIMDLRTGAAFDVQGTVAGSADRLVASTPGRVTAIATASAPPLPGCP